jgi:hypothetical protein
VGRQDLWSMSRDEQGRRAWSAGVSLVCLVLVRATSSHTSTSTPTTPSATLT